MAPLTPKKPLENDCPYDVQGNGEPSMEMSSTSETANNAELVIPPPDTNAVSTADEDYNPAEVLGFARLNCSHHLPIPYDAVVDPSIPPPAILPPSPPSLVSLSLSTLSSYDARATVLAVDNGVAVPIVVLPAFKDQTRSMIANNEAAHNDNSQHRHNDNNQHQQASFRSGGGSAPMDPPASRIHSMQPSCQLVSLPPPKVSSHELKTSEAAAAAEAAPITVVAAIAMSHDALEDPGKFESVDC